MSESNQPVTLFTSNNPNVANALAKLANDAGGGKPYLRFGKDGRWSWGVEQNEISEETLLAVNPASIQLGFIAWHQGQAQEHMAYIHEPTIQVQDLPNVPTDQNKGWQEQSGLDLKMLDGAQTQMTFKTSSLGGKEAVATLVKAMVEHASVHPETPVAAVRLKNTSYKHPEYGKIYKPVLEVVDWLTQEGEPARKALI